MSKGNLLANRNRRKSIGNINQLTSSMELIASNRFRKSRDRIDNLNKMNAIASNFIDEISLTKKIVIAIGSTLSLCGAYNLNLAKNIDSVDIDVGKQLQNILSKRGLNFERIINIGDIYQKVIEGCDIEVIYGKYINGDVEIVKESIFDFSKEKYVVKEYDRYEALKIYLNI